MTIKLIGYSERGLMNALCDDLYRSSDPKAIRQFLSLFDFPFSLQGIEEATLIVEQSFSDFGDADLLVMLDYEHDVRKAIFIEAKVSNDTDSWLTIEDRWEEFLRLVDGGEGSNSNLFVQLHRKVRLVDKLQSKDTPFEPDALTPRGNLGSNQVISRAVEIVTDYIRANDTWFTAILPDRSDVLKRFAADTFEPNETLATLPRWCPQRWRFLSWHSIAEQLIGEHWQRTQATFEWNRGQIFRNVSPRQQSIVFGQMYLFRDTPVYIVDAGRGKTCRVARMDESRGNNFWRTTNVDVNQLTPLQNSVQQYELPRLPDVQRCYAWNPEDESPINPEKNIHFDIMPGMMVTVVSPSWHTTRVRLPKGVETDTFLVFTHHLRRNADELLPEPIH